MARTALLQRPLRAERRRPGLARDLPPLTRARYRLRRLRPGRLYLVLREQLHALRIDEDGDLSAGEENAGGLEAAEIGIREAGLPLPKGAGTAWLAYSMSQGLICRH